MSIDVTFSDGVKRDPILYQTLAKPLTAGAAIYDLDKFDFSGQSQEQDPLYNLRFQAASYQERVGALSHYLYQYALELTTEDAGLPNKLTAEHYALGTQITNYYNSKLTLMRMLDQPITEYMEKANRYLLQPNEGWLREGEFGMLGSLPATYLVDIEIDRCLEKSTSIEKTKYAEFLGEFDRVHCGENTKAELIGAFRVVSSNFVAAFIFREFSTGAMIVNFISKNPGYELLIEYLQTRRDFELDIAYMKFRECGQQTYFTVYDQSIIPEGYKGL